MIKLVCFAGFLVLAHEVLVAYACSCARSNTYNKYCESNAVLLVNPIEYIDHGNNFRMSYTAEVLKVFKSKEPITGNTTTINTAKYDSLCGMHLTLNQKTVISAFNEGPDLWIDLCNSINMNYNSALENFGDDFDCNCRLRIGYPFDGRYDEKKLCPWIAYLRCRDGRTTCGLDDHGQCQWRCVSDSS
ncbi:uncharacterized protein LOC125675788 [Ostrea edulis]|uniref:uncharacterized protein LOC125675788 n=1 Tax=Ostrea edulis TaxID=37623 RepID=UPI0024AE9F10|nr:uncharacterized protein LOC125675788 [Ostrea edulis]XP_056014613.1 uncharacterized protein LOC125675788 [Ostrea edulis]